MSTLHSIPVLATKRLIEYCYPVSCTKLPEAMVGIKPHSFNKRISQASGCPHSLSFLEEN